MASFQGWQEFDRISQRTRKSAGRWRRALGLACLSGVVGCTELDSESDDYCGLVLGGRDCPEDAPPDGGNMTPSGPPGPFDCLPGGEPPFVPMSPAPPLVNYIVGVVDATNPDPNRSPTDLTIRACVAQNPECLPGSEVPSIVTQTVPNAPGAAKSILLPYGLNGYLVLQAPGYLRTEYYFGGPMIGAPTPTNPAGDSFELPVPPEAAPLLMVPPGTRIQVPIVRGQPIAMVRDTEVDALFADLANGRQRDVNAGLIALRMLDCNGERAAGVSLDMDANDLGNGFGFVVTANNIPRPSNPSSPSGPTEGQQGGAGFANVPPGGYSPRGILEDGTVYGGEVGMRVRAGQFTNGEVRASYRYGR